jgi:hypothetical protein
MCKQGTRPVLDRVQPTAIGSPPDSPLERDGFSPRSAVGPFGRTRTPYQEDKSSAKAQERAELEVRIHLPPAESRQRTRFGRTRDNGKWRCGGDRHDRTNSSLGSVAGALWRGVPSGAVLGHGLLHPLWLRLFRHLHVSSHQMCMSGRRPAMRLRAEFPFAGITNHLLGFQDSFRPSSQITRFSASTDSSLRDSPSSVQKISTLCSPISGARLEIRQGEPL